MRVLIIGLGSIALRHISALRAHDPDVEIFALRSGTSSVQVSGVKDCLALSEVPRDIDFVLIANPTSEHKSTIKSMIGLAKPIFLEKPPISSLNGADELSGLIEDSGVLLYTAFNLRFHPVIQWAKVELDGQQVIEVSAYCGSYLPEWRKGVDYRQVYSSRADLGGGVHLDLIHELDYLTYLFGSPLSVQSRLGRFSQLEIDSVDSACYLLSYPEFTATLMLNYFRRTTKRTLEVVTNDGGYLIDLIRFKVFDLENKELFAAEPDVQHSYNAQMTYFIKLISGRANAMNGFDESVNTLKMALAAS